MDGGLINAGDATRWGKAWIVIANHLFLGGRGERPRQMMRQGQDRSGADARQGGTGLSRCRGGSAEIRRRPADRASPAVRQGDDHESGAPPRSLRQCRKLLTEKRMAWVRDPDFAYQPIKNRGSMRRLAVAASRTPLVIVLASQTKTISLILQGQRGTSAFLTRNSGHSKMG